jgi:hypothetical protein
MSNVRPLFSFWLLFPAVTMSLGWGLRGFIGGGPLGAMIPGVMVALAVALLLGRKTDLGWIAACGAIGVGFGGQETYGQTVGLSFQPETFWWAMTGFAIKGGAWGLLGGIVLGLGLTRAAAKWTKRDVLSGLLLLMGGIWAGRVLINAPKLVYFSNRVDRPREELWAGLILGSLLLLGWMTMKGAGRVPPLFALYGTVGGGIGFALGAAFQALGRASGWAPWLDWWKVMEFTFGALLGAAYGWAAYRSRQEVADRSAAEAGGRSLWFGVGAAALLALIAIGMEDGLDLRFGYTVAGSLLLASALYSEAAAWQAAMTVTACSFFLDMVEKPMLRGFPGWAFVAAASIAVAWVTARRPEPRTMFLVMTWSGVGVSLLKVYLPPAALDPGSASMEAAFVAMGLAATWWAVRLTARSA